MRTLGCLALLAAAQPLRADSIAGRSQQLQMALDQYLAAKTPAQRSTVIDFLKQQAPAAVGAAIAQQIAEAQNGHDATEYAGLAENFAPAACQQITALLGSTPDAAVKGKMVVALAHCPGDDAVQALTACLDDQRPVTFEARGAHPRRVCDFAYDELFLKLRSQPRFGLDASSHKRGLITEKTTGAERDARIAKLKAQLAEKSTPAPQPSPTPASSSPNAHRGNTIACLSNPGL